MRRKKKCFKNIIYVRHSFDSDQHVTTMKLPHMRRRLLSFSPNYLQFDIFITFYNNKEDEEEVEKILSHATT